MKSILLAAAIGVMSTGMAMADPVLGTWKTQVDDGAYAHIAMKKCGSSICGTIARTFTAGGETKSDNIGKKLVWDMKPDGANYYSGGKIWQPSTDKIYKSKMTLAGNRLKVAGCFGPICKKQTWSRIK